jgi:hypothetical protein
MCGLILGFRVPSQEGGCVDAACAPIVARNSIGSLNLLIFFKSSHDLPLI